MVLILWLMDVQISEFGLAVEPGLLVLRVKFPFTTLQLESSPPQTPHWSSRCSEAICPSHPTCYRRGRAGKGTKGNRLLVQDLRPYIYIFELIHL